MPLLESHKKYIDDSLNIFFEDLPTTNEHFSSIVTGLKGLYDEAVAHPLNEAQRARQTGESPEAYDFYCIVVYPQKFFNMNDIAQLTLAELLVGILAYSQEQLRNYNNGSFSGLVNTLWNPRESIAKIHISKNTPFVPIKPDDNLLVGDQGWQLPATPNQNFHAYITQSSIAITGTTTRYIAMTLNIVVTLSNGNRWPLALVDYMQISNDETQKRIILEKSARIAESLATEVILYFLNGNLTVENFSALSVVPSAGFTAAEIAEKGDNLLTYPYYFAMVAEGKIDMDTVGDLELDEIQVLRSFAVIRLQEEKIIDFEDAYTLGIKFLKVLEEPLYLHLLVTKQIQICDILTLTDTQLSVITLPAIINMQMRNNSISFNKVKEITPHGAQLLLDKAYYEKVIAEKFKFEILYYVNQAMLSVMTESRMVTVLDEVDNITAPHLKLLFLPNYRSQVLSGKLNLNTLQNFTDEQFNSLQTNDISALIEHEIITPAQALTLPEEKLKIISLQTLQWLLIEKIITLAQATQTTLGNAELLAQSPQLVEYLVQKNFIADYPYIINMILGAHFFFERLSEAAKNPFSEDSAGIILNLKQPLKLACATTTGISLQSLMALISKLFLVELYNSNTETQKPACFAAIQDLMLHDRELTLHHFEQSWLTLFHNLSTEAETQLAQGIIPRICSPGFFQSGPSATTTAYTNVLNFSTVINHVLNVISMPELQPVRSRGPA